MGTGGERCSTTRRRTMQFRGGSQIQILFDQGLLNLKIQIQSVQNFLTNDTLRDIERYSSYPHD